MRPAPPTRPEHWPAYLRIGAALVITCAAILYTQAVPALHANAVFLLPTSAIAICALYFGLGATLVATLAAVPLIHRLLLGSPLTPEHVAAVDVLAFAVFVAVSIVISSLAARYRAAQDKLLADRAAAAVEAQRAQSVAEQALATRRLVEQRLTLLLQASQPLTGAIHVESALREILSVAKQLIRADAYAVWRFGSRTPGSWYIAASEGLSDEYQQVIISDLLQRASRSAMLERPIVVEDVDAFKAGATRREQYRREGIQSFLAVPLRVQEQAEGTIVFYYRAIRRFDPADIESATALGNLAAAAIHNAELFETADRLRAEAQDSERRSAFLAEVSTTLSGSLDYQLTLSKVAALAVPRLADWCMVDMLRDDGTIERLAVAHEHPATPEWITALPAPALTDSRGPGLVIRTGQPQSQLEVTTEVLETAARTPEEFERWRRLEISSYVCVPLTVRGRTVGALTLTTAHGRRLTQGDFSLALELGRRAAQAIENSWLYRAAQDANRAKDEFLATLSHELRTPLNAIFGWSRMLASGTLDAATAKRAVEVIERNARTQTQLIEDILDVSRIITGKLRMDVRPVDLRHAITGAIDALQPAADGKAITLRVDLPADPGLVAGDADRLQQVVWNLVSNAIRYAPRGGRVDVELRRVDPHLELDVTDDGSGIAPDLLPFVFDRFRQGDSTVTRSHGGLGLGLAIVRHIIELHGGTVSAHSEGIGRGARFVVQLPLSSAAAAAADPGAAHGHAGERDQPSPLVATGVLVVDDDADSRTLVAAILERHGIEVRTAGSAAEALRALDEWTPHVIVSDIGMPGTDGYELLRRIRASGGRSRQIPAIALTAYAGADDRIKALAAGYQLHLAKPVEPVQLVSLVSALRGNSSYVPA